MEYQGAIVTNSRDEILEKATASDIDLMYKQLAAAKAPEKEKSAEIAAKAPGKEKSAKIAAKAPGKEKSAEIAAKAPGK